MIINHNINAMNAHRNLAYASTQQGKSSEKLSSGYRINRAADDAAGLSISQKMRAQITGLDQGARNTQDGISLVQTADGAMNEVSDMLTRMKSLATQANNGTYNTSDLAAMDSEYQSLTKAINNIANQTTFNGINLLNNSSATVNIQYGGDASNTVSISMANISSLSLGAVSSTTAAASALTAIDTAVGQVNTARSQFGAAQNQLEHIYNNVSTTHENMQAAESRIRDTDMASEMMNYTKWNILVQSSTSMLAQANQAPQSVLQLLH